MMNINKHIKEVQKRGDGMTLSVCEPKDGLKPRRFPILNGGDAFMDIRFCPVCGVFLESEDSSK